jgi:hypothetical protein
LNLNVPCVADVGAPHRHGSDLAAVAVAAAAAAAAALALQRHWPLGYWILILLPLMLLMLLTLMVWPLDAVARPCCQQMLHLLLWPWL